MTIGLTDIPEVELLSDLRAAVDDMNNAMAARALGVTECSTGSIDTRIRLNRLTIVRILEELERRDGR